MIRGAAVIAGALFVVGAVLFAATAVCLWVLYAVEDWAHRDDDESHKKP